MWALMLSSPFRTATNIPSLIRKYFSNQIAFIYLPLLIAYSLNTPTMLFMQCYCCIIRWALSRREPGVFFEMQDWQTVTDIGQCPHLCLVAALARYIVTATVALKASLSRHGWKKGKTYYLAPRHPLLKITMLL